MQPLKTRRNLQTRRLPKLKRPHRNLFLLSRPQKTLTSIRQKSRPRPRSKQQILRRRQQVQLLNLPRVQAVRRWPRLLARQVRPYKRLPMRGPRLHHTKLRQMPPLPPMAGLRGLPQLIEFLLLIPHLLRRVMPARPICRRNWRRKPQALQRMPSFSRA